MRQADFRPGRRGFLQGTAAAGLVLSLDQLDFLPKLRPVTAAEAELSGDAVRFTDDIEPLVRLLEETPRERVVETFAAKIHEGTGYREVLAALLLAGVRNVQPRPAVGFKFHAVLVVNSAHLASLASPDRDRWLPIFWALDYFKSAQASDVDEGDWTMPAVAEHLVPPPEKAREAFRAAMERWDESAADAATVALARSAGANEVFDLMAHYGCRDFRSIGHKAIYVANAFRTLHCIGWRYSEPVLRSLTYAMLNHHGEPNPAESDLAADAAWRETDRRASELKKHLYGGRIDVAATTSLVDSLRTASPTEAVDLVCDAVARGVAVQSVNDALFLSASEMVMQQPGIVSLHSATSTNALQYAFRTAGDQETRCRLLLQNAAFIPYFREAMSSRGKVAVRRIDEFAEAESEGPTASIDEIFSEVSSDRRAAAADLLRYLNAGGDGEDVIRAARRLVFLKGNDSHDYKYSSAVLEDYANVSPQFRNACLAAAAHLLPGSGDRDNGLVNRVRSALA